MSSADIEATAKKLNMGEIVAVSSAAGLSLSSADKRTRKSLLNKWHGQGAALRAKLVAGALQLKARGAPPTVRLPTPAAQQLPLADDRIKGIAANTIQLAMQAAGVRDARLIGRSRRNTEGLFASLSPDLQDEVLAKATLIRISGKRTRGEGCSDIYSQSLNLDEPTESTSSMLVPERPRKRARLDMPQDLVNGPFLADLPASTITERTLRFISATGNDALSKEVCGVCARRLPASTTSSMPVAQIPCPLLLTPHEPHPSHTLHNGMLLYSPAVKDGRTTICNDCIRALRNSQIPSLSLANNMWVGDIPAVLSVLTLPERVLIARYFPAAYVVKLYPKNPAFRPDPRTLTSGLRGNVTTYPLDVQKLSNFVNTLRLPQPLQILAATIGVTFVGVNNVPEKALRGLFAVSRLRVEAALQWLCANNPLYANVQINDESLNALPVDDVPRQLRQVMRVAENDSALLREHAGYVPVHPNDHALHVNRSDAEVAIPEDDEPGSQDADVIPMMAHGMIDTDAAFVSDSDLLSAALANTAAKLAQEPDIQVKHGSAMVNEYPRTKQGTSERWTGGVDNPNHLLAAFPVLFPYGLGGFEVGRPKDVSYEKHIQWALQYADRRFRVDLQFIFQVFGVVLKRQICRSAVVQVKRASYSKHAAAIAMLRPVDFANASVEEANHRPFSNPTVQLFRGQLSALRSNVAGTDESRRAIRGQIWGCTLVHGPPSLWVTINPSDINDPVAQVLAGESIDLDDFIAQAGPDKQARAYNVAADPFAASEFFHITIRAFLKELLGISAVDLRGRARIQRHIGIFGSIKAYIGTVEAQGRGMLHLHLLLWLDGAPTSQNMTAALREEDFREKVRVWLEKNITADIDGMTSQAIDELPHNSECSFSRPLVPNSETYSIERKQRLPLLARSLQLHSCQGRGCVQKIKGVLKCKRRAPYPCAPSAWVTEAGEWGPRRLHGMVVAFNPTILLTMRCNHDVKLLTNAFDTRGIAWYITFYATKKQQKSGNSSAVLARRLAYHFAQEAGDKDVDDMHRRMINRCANALNREQEFSAPEVIGYLMGWGDRYISHHYVTIFWDSVVYGLKAEFPELRNKSHKDSVGPVETESQVHDTGEDRTCSLLPKAGRIVVKDQKNEYMYRGRVLEDMTYWDYFLDTYEQKVSSDSNISTKSAVAYEAGGPTDAVRRTRLLGHEMLPQFVGQWFPSRRDIESKELYCACMLALFTPWRLFGDLKRPEQSFHDRFVLFMEDCPSDVAAIMDNMEYYYLSAEAASIDRPVAELGPVHKLADMEDSYTNSEEFEPASLATADLEGAVTDEDIETERQGVYTLADRRFAQQAMALAYNSHVFDDTLEPSNPWMNLCKQATNSDTDAFDAWSSRLQNYIRNEQDDITQLAPKLGQDFNADVLADATVSLSSVQNPSVQTFGEPAVGDVASTTSTLSLNVEQQRALDIIKHHMMQTVRSSEHDQLLMVVNGPGGTGKSALIDAITETMDDSGVRHWLAKTATSGVAATKIGGTTVHSWAGLGVVTKAGTALNASDKTLSKRKTNMQHAKYLIIDEYSMLTKSFLEILSEVCCLTKCRIGHCTRGAFGGLNIILFGDLHQFPPIMRKGALYYPDDAKDGTSIGRQLYELFRTVVTLSTQMRTKDARWTEMLDRLREGACTSGDVRMVKQLIVSDDACPPTDFSRPPWSNAVLVTSRNSVRDAWNNAALRRHSFSTGHVTYICPAEDTIGKDRRPLSRLEKLTAAGLAGKVTGRLAFQTSIAIGMRGMVLMNIATESDLANGSRGTVVDIALDPREEMLSVDGEGEVHLSYPPACVIFRLDHSSFPVFDGLGPNEVPIFPSQMSYTLPAVGGKGKTVKRRQLAITAAYAFTDYKAQGQTIEHVVVDLAESTRNSLDPFHAYVALSRSRGRETIRLLREFNSSLLTTHPSVHLRPEDKRLQELNDATTAKWSSQRSDDRVDGAQLAAEFVN